jgi:VWFA-related protein
MPCRGPAARRIAAACILAALPAPSSGQAERVIPPPILEIATVTRVVDVYATVQDARGHLVTGVGRDAFELRENGVPQQVDYFANETDAPLSLGLVIDTSASQAQLLPTEQEKAGAFLRSVLVASDRAFVMCFDQEVVLVQGLTNDASLLARAIDTVRGDRGSGPIPAHPSKGRPRGTRLYDAIQQASALLRGQKGRKVLVLLTDGEDQGSRLTRAAALEAAERAEVIVYSVLVADPLFYWVRGREFEGEKALAELQAKTGGWMVRPETAQGLEDIAAELRAQYRLGYSPRTARYDGSFRRIEVRLRGIHYTVRARRGYYATAE